jgi:hypothetical protein
MRAAAIGRTPRTEGCAAPSFRVCTVTSVEIGHYHIMRLQTASAPIHATAICTETVETGQKRIMHASSALLLRLPAPPQI